MIFCLTVPSIATVFKIATLSPEGSVWMEKMREGAQQIAKETNNRVKFKYYPGGVMGSDQSVLRKIKVGQLHGGAIVSGSLSDTYPDIQIYSLPFAFKSFQEVDYVRERMDKLIISGLEKNGWIAFGIAEGGFAYVMSDSPVKSLEDLRAKKVWVPENDTIAIETVKSYGINPIPLSMAEVRAALQTGLINTIGTSPIGAVALQWFTQVSYVMDVPMMYIYAMLAVKKKAFEKLSIEDQKTVRRIMNGVFADLNVINREDNFQASSALVKQGIQFVKPDPEQLEQWEGSSESFRENLQNSGRISKQMIDLLDGYLSEYRTQNSIEQ
jgi:TRAP-type C4-dicarboxylate transport system substrate-binding protein